MKDQRLRISTMIKTFIESSKFRSDIGTTLLSRAPKASDDFTYLCQEKFCTCAFSGTGLGAFLCADLISWMPQAIVGDGRIPSPGFCLAAYTYIAAYFKFPSFIF